MATGTWTLAVSISIHDGQEDKPSIEAVHMLMFNDVKCTEDEATLKRNLLIEIAKQFGLGVYKVEHPREVH